MKSKQLKIYLIALSIMFTPTAFAELSFYAGVGVGRSSIDVDRGQLTTDLAARGHTVTAIGVDDTATTWKIFGGLRFLPRGSFELGYVDPGTLAVNVDGSSINSQRFFSDLAELQDIAPEGVYADIVGRYPLSDTINVFGRLGAFFWESEVHYVGTGVDARHSREGLDAHFGTGLEFTTDSKFAVRLEIERFEGDTPLDFLSISGIYEF